MICTPMIVMYRFNYYYCDYYYYNYYLHPLNEKEKETDTLRAYIYVYLYIGLFSPHLVSFLFSSSVYFSFSFFNILEMYFLLAR